MSQAAVLLKAGTFAGASEDQEHFRTRTTAQSAARDFANLPLLFANSSSTKFFLNPDTTFSSPSQHPSHTLIHAGLLHLHRLFRRFIRKAIAKHEGGSIFECGSVAQGAPGQGLWDDVQPHTRPYRRQSAAPKIAGPLDAQLLPFHR